MRPLARFRAWRLERAELALADAEHHYDCWVRPFRSSPSEVKYAKQQTPKPTYVPKPISELRVRELIYAEIVRAGAGR